MFKLTTYIRYCGGSTFSFCGHEESEQWPKYFDSHGIKRCCVCNRQGPMIDNMITMDDLLSVKKGGLLALVGKNEPEEHQPSGTKGISRIDLLSVKTYRSKL